MAIPYSFLRLEESASTQDVARSRFQGSPLLVLADRQTAGRGRSGASWENAPRSLAVSLAFRGGRSTSVVPLLAGVAAVRTLGDAFGLKWPNDVMSDDRKVGGILVEASGALVVVGLGLNLWWPDPPAGVGAVFPEDPGESSAAGMAEAWATELLDMSEESEWPRSEYRSRCVTIGRRLTWQPAGSGRAVDIAPDGSLVVETPDGLITLRSGAVTHVRSDP